MSQKPMPSRLEQFVVSFCALSCFVILFWIALAAVTYAGGIELTDFFNSLNAKLNN